MPKAPTDPTCPTWWRSRATHKLLNNEAVKSYIQRHEPEILGQFELVVNTVSMEEAVQQQVNTTSAEVS